MGLGCLASGDALGDGALDGANGACDRLGDGNCRRDWIRWVGDGRCHSEVESVGASDGRGDFRGGGSDRHGARRGDGGCDRDGH